MSNVVDIAPELLDKIQKDFKKSFQNDNTIKEIYGLIQNGLVSYEEANQFSIRCGELLSQSYLKYLTNETLPEGKLWFNIAEKILTPTLTQNYDLITEVCSYAQENVNKVSGVNIQYIKPDINQNRIDGFVDKVSSYEKYDDAKWMLEEPVVNYSQSVVDDSIRTNADFHAKSGLTPQLVRKVDIFERRIALRGKTRVSYSIPCQWCIGLAGTFDYYSAPSDIYRRHENCRCTVEYVSDKKKQDVWSKRIYNSSQVGIPINNIELYRKKFSISSNGEEKTYKQAPRKITRDTIKRIERMGGIVIIGDPEWEEYLNKRNATAATIDDVVILKSNHTISDLLEEERHLWQNINGINDDKSHDIRTVLNEIDSKEYLLKQKKYHIPIAESNDTKRQLDELEEVLKELMERGDYNEDN